MGCYANLDVHSELFQYMHHGCCWLLLFSCRFVLWYWSKAVLCCTGCSIYWSIHCGFVDRDIYFSCQRVRQRKCWNWIDFFCIALILYFVCLMAFVMPNNQLEEIYKTLLPVLMARSFLSLYVPSTHCSRKLLAFCLCHGYNYIICGKEGFVSNLARVWWWL